MAKNYVPKGFKFAECYKKARDCIKTEKYNEVHGLNKHKKDKNKENNAKEDDGNKEAEGEVEEEEIIEVENDD